MTQIVLAWYEGRALSCIWDNAFGESFIQDSVEKALEYMKRSSGHHLFSVYIFPTSELQVLEKARDLLLKTLEGSLRDVVDMRKDESPG